MFSVTHSVYILAVKKTVYLYYSSMRWALYAMRLLSLDCCCPLRCWARGRCRRTSAR